MHSALLSSSRFGKFYAKRQQNIRTIELTNADIFESLTFTITGEKIYLLDRSGNLTCLTLNDSSVSTFTSNKLSHYQIQSTNPYSVYAISKKSQLYHISFQNKKSTKIMNLNIGRVLSFQKNHFTNLVLIVQFQVVMVIDLNAVNINKIRSIKATNGDTFTGGYFLNKNRFIILAVKTNELRVVQVLGMKVLHKVLLPYQIKGIKLQSSIDGSTMAIYGESNKLIVAKVSNNGQLTYQTVQLPIQSILQLKFTYENDIIFLGNDRIVYVIKSANSNRLYQLFNSRQQIVMNVLYQRFSNFDISLNAKSLCLIASKTIHLVSLEKGLHKLLQDSQGGLHIQFIQENRSNKNGINKQIQYQDEDNQKEENKHHNQNLQELLANLPQIGQNQSQSEEIIEEVKNLRTSRLQKISINKIYTYLHQFQVSRTLVHIHKSSVIQFIQIILRTIKNQKQSAAIAYHILNLLGSSIKDGSLEKYALILAPRIFEKIQKYEGEFIQFITKNLLNLFRDYISEEKSHQIVHIILKNRKRQSFLPIFIISLILQMRINSQSWPFPHIQNIDISEVLTQAQNLMSNPKQAYIFAKEPNQKEISIQHEENQNLEILLRRQQELKNTLENIRSNYV